MSDYNSPNKGAFKFRNKSNKKSIKGVIVGVSLTACSCFALFFVFNRGGDNRTAIDQNPVEYSSNSYQDSLTQETSNDSSLATTVLQSQNSFESDIAALEYDTVGSKFYYDNHTYQLFRMYNITGNDVIAFCKSQNGYFAHIDSEPENAFIASTIGSLGYDIVYFGYSDEQSEGNWYWIDGESSSFVNWRSGEPNNEANKEHYALISPDGTWNDGKLELDSQSGAIILCEWNTSIETDTPHLSDYHSHIINVSSSSHLENQTYSDKTYVYTAEKAFDKDMSSCWSEGLDGYGVGESITVSFDNIYEVSEISIWNGLCTNEDLYNKNSRLHNFTVILSDGSRYDFECSDGWDKRNQIFSFDGSVKSSSLTIIIQSVYEGEKYKDTCISEISVS